MEPICIEEGRLLRSVSRSGKVNRDTLSDWAVWSIVEQSSKQIGIEHFGAHDLRRTLRQTLPEERRRSRADQVPSGAFVDPDDRALSRVGAGDRRGGE
jgi:integrase